MPRTSNRPPEVPVLRMLWTVNTAVVRIALREAHEQARAQFVSGLHTLRSLHHRPASTLIALLWTVGILGDATTTLAMMGSGLTEEGNPAAAGLMGLVGVEGWVLGASAVCLALAVLSLARVPGLYAITIRATCLLLGVGKAYIAVSNALLWLALT